MLNQPNILTALGCSGSLALALTMAQPVMASHADQPTDNGIPHLVQADSNPILDALECSCARCLLGQQQTSM